LEGFFRDVRHALRSLLRTPRFTGLVVAILGLGIGSATAVFSVVNAALLRPLPYPAVDELGLVEGNFLRLGLLGIGASAPEFLEYREQRGLFADAAAFRNVSLNLTGGADPERIVGARVSAAAPNVNTRAASRSWMWRAAAATMDAGCAAKDGQIRQLDETEAGFRLASISKVCRLR